MPSKAVFFPPTCVNKIDPVISVQRLSFLHLKGMPSPALYNVWIVTSEGHLLYAQKQMKVHYLYPLWSLTSQFPQPHWLAGGSQRWNQGIHSPLHAGGRHINGCCKWSIHAGDYEISRLATWVHIYADLLQTSVWVLPRFSECTCFLRSCIIINF